MQQTGDALRRVRAVAMVAVESRIAQVLNPAEELAPFMHKMERLRSSLGSEGAKQPAGIDVNALWERWRPEARAPLAVFGVRELRALCWDRRAVSDPRFLWAIESEGHVPRKSGFLRGLWHVHQHHWRLPTAARLEALFERAVSLGGHQPRWLRTAMSIPGVFSEAAPPAVARTFFADLTKLVQALESLGLSPDGSLAQRSVQKCRRQWLESLSRSAMQNSTEVTDLLHAGLTSVLDKELTSAEDFRATVEQLLQMLGKSGQRYRTALAEWIVNDLRLGHPRRNATSANWVGFSEEAKLAALRLFAAKDIGRFFDILIGRANDEQGRRAFWEQYTSSPQLMDYSIACDSVDRRRLIAAWTEGKPDVAILDDAPAEHSAFVMRFRSTQYDLIIVEMSKANNSMYLFTTEVFERAVGSLMRARFRFRALKDRDVAEEHWRHAGAWEDRFAARLYGYGIYRGVR